VRADGSSARQPFQNNFSLQLELVDTTGSPAVALQSVSAQRHGACESGRTSARAQAYALASGAYGAYSSTAQNRREWTPSRSETRAD
jgi:hypothetical protein